MATSHKGACLTGGHSVSLTTCMIRGCHHRKHVQVAAPHGACSAAGPTTAHACRCSCPECGAQHTSQSMEEVLSSNHSMPPSGAADVELLQRQAALKLAGTSVQRWAAAMADMRLL